MDIPKEIQDAVDAFNEKAYELVEKEDELSDWYNLFSLTYESDGNVFLIHYLGEMIWNSDNDERPYKDKNEDELIPLYDFLTAETKKINAFIMRLDTLL